MDGSTALKFVRSRHAVGDEGTDLAREARQQKVISAIKQKILDPQTLLDPKKVKMLMQVLEKYVETDMPQEDAAAVARYAFESSANVKSFVLPENLLINPSRSSLYDNQYVFIPVGGNWDKVHGWINEQLN
jgi:anionic cell wall polymer biosynthesis LytR-Cps2A-Psr (LCP) family protein